MSEEPACQAFIAATEDHWRTYDSLSICAGAVTALTVHRSSLDQFPRRRNRGLATRETTANDCAKTTGHALADVLGRRGRCPHRLLSNGPPAGDHELQHGRCCSVLAPSRCSRRCIHRASDTTLYHHQLPNMSPNGQWAPTPCSIDAFQPPTYACVHAGVGIAVGRLHWSALRWTVCRCHWAADHAVDVKRVPCERRNYVSHSSKVHSVSCRQVSDHKVLS